MRAMRAGPEPERRWSSTPSGLPNPHIPGSRPAGGAAGGRLRVGQRTRRVSTPALVGTVRFLGEVEGRTGTWVGVEWDQLDAGDMNGEVDGRRLFEVSHRGQRSRTCASLCRESDLAVNGASSRARPDTPLAARPQVLSRRLEPCLRTKYSRTAFQAASSNAARPPAPRLTP